MHRILSRKIIYSSGTATRVCYYKTLNVSTEATIDQIKKAYFDMAKKYHPDMNRNTTVDPRQFQQIQEAYQTLSNDDRRRKYDEENGIINVQYTSDASFGEQQNIYEKFAQQESIYEKKNDQFVNYFDLQYFKNKDYFKRKVNEDDPFNLSEKLFMKHQKIQEKKDQYKIHHPFTDTAYFVHKDELKPITKIQFLKGIIVDFKYLWITLFVGTIGYFTIQFYEQQAQGKRKPSDSIHLKDGQGYRLQIYPINIV